MVTTRHRLPVPTPPEPDAAPRELVDGRFALLDRLGAGGMAEVWSARDQRTGDTVAIKRLHPHLRADEAALERFRREAEAGEAVLGPRVVTVRESRIDGDEAYLVMDHVAGGSLADRLARDRSLPVLAAVRFARDVAEGLAAAHARGIVHRDVTASNILLDPEDGARLADFGIARPMDDLRAVTAVGDIVGTLRAMAPEVLAGDPPTPASDVWSLGAVLYESVVGRAPFEGAAPAALLTARQARPSPVEGLPEALNDLLMHMLDPDPSLRPVDGGAAAAALGVIAARLSNDRAAPDDVTREMPVVVAPALLAAASAPVPNQTLVPAVTASAPGDAGRRGPGRRVAVGVAAALAVAILGFAALAAGPLAAPASENATPPASIAPSPSPEPAVTVAPVVVDPVAPGKGQDKDKENAPGKGKGENNGQGGGQGRGN